MFFDVVFNNINKGYYLRGFESGTGEIKRFSLLFYYRKSEKKLNEINRQIKNINSVINQHILDNNELINKFDLMHDLIIKIYS